MKSTKGILFCLHLHPLPQLFCHLRSNIDPCVSEIILEASKQLVLGKFFVQKPSLYLDQAFQVLHLLLFISAKRTFICAKRCINNLYCTFLNTASNIIGAKRLSIAIFKYARAFNSINRQSTKRRDNHLGGTLFHVRAMKIQ